jgi:hypothetical protein
MTKWHYCTGKFDSSEELLPKGLEPLGKLGWELVCLEKTNAVAQAELHKWFAVFKRPAKVEIRKEILYGVGGFWFAVGLLLVVAGFHQWTLPFNLSLIGLGFTLIGLSLMFWDKAKS